MHGRSLFPFRGFMMTCPLFGVKKQPRNSVKFVVIEDNNKRELTKKIMESRGVSASRAKRAKFDYYFWGKKNSVDVD